MMVYFESSHVYIQTYISCAIYNSPNYHMYTDEHHNHEHMCIPDVDKQVIGDCKLLSSCVYMLHSSGIHKASLVL